MKEKLLGGFIMKKIFNKKNLKKGLSYLAVAIGGAVVATAALVHYGKKLEDETCSMEISEEEFKNRFPDLEFKAGANIKLQQQPDDTWQIVESFE